MVVLLENVLSHAQAASIVRTVVKNHRQATRSVPHGLPSAFVGHPDRLRPDLDHGFLEADNNSAERSMRCVALGRKNYLFMGSERGGQSAAIAYTLIETAKLNGIDPRPG
jgi:hypothetical protein